MDAWVFRQYVCGGNYGPEMDVSVPERDIVPAGHLGDTGNSTKTGTGYGDAACCWLVCYLRALEGGLGSPKEVANKTFQLTLRDIVGDPKGSPNLLINIEVAAEGPYIILAFIAIHVGFPAMRMGTYRAQPRRQPG